MTILDPFWQSTIAEGRFELFTAPNTIYVGRSSASAFVDWLVGKKNILGFDGLSYDGKSYISLIDCIADFSENGTTTRPTQYESAKKILESKEFQKAQFIEFVLEDVHAEG